MAANTIKSYLKYSQWSWASIENACGALSETTLQKKTVNVARQEFTIFSFGLTRQNALGYNNFMSRLGVSMAPLVLLLEDLWTLLPQIIICFVAILCGVSCLLLPETRNVMLPESIDDIERQRLVDPDIRRIWHRFKYINVQQYCKNNMVFVFISFQ